jgi:hypothetical protein
MRHKTLLDVFVEKIKSFTKSAPTLEQIYFKNLHPKKKE